MDRCWDASGNYGTYNISLSAKMWLKRRKRPRWNDKKNLLHPQTLVLLCIPKIINFCRDLSGWDTFLCWWHHVSGETHTHSLSFLSHVHSMAHRWWYLGWHSFHISSRAADTYANLSPLEHTRLCEGVTYWCPCLFKETIPHPALSITFHLNPRYLG